MTWELVIFLSVLIVSGVVLFELSARRKLEASKQIKTSEVVELNNHMRSLYSRVELLEKIDLKIKEEHESVMKVAEETKKLLSQSNLGMAFIPRGKRGG